jgi:hypothetical protein
MLRLVRTVSEYMGIAGPAAPAAANSPCVLRRPRRMDDDTAVLQPRKKRRVRPVGITDMPDNVVLRLCCLLAGAPRRGELSGRALVQASQAHALATTCKRFYCVFKSAALRRIVYDYSSVVVVSASRGGRHEEQLARLCGFAGEHLYRLTITGCYEGNFERLFDVLIKKCPKLVHLAVYDSDYEFPFSTALLALILSRPWRSLRLPMEMRSAVVQHPNPSPSEPDSDFLLRCVNAGAAVSVSEDATLGSSTGAGDGLKSYASTANNKVFLQLPSLEAAVSDDDGIVNIASDKDSPVAGCLKGPQRQLPAALAELTDIAFPTRLPSCTEASIMRFWHALPNLRVLALSADLPETVLNFLPAACPNLVELRLNMVSRRPDEATVLRESFNSRYSKLCTEYSRTLERLQLGYFDLTPAFAYGIVSYCARLTAVDIRQCRGFDAAVCKEFGSRLVGLRSTRIDATSLKYVPIFATRLEAFDLMVTEDVVGFDGVDIDLTEAISAWARVAATSSSCLKHLIIKGMGNANFAVLWGAIISTFSGALRTARPDQIPALESLSVEGVTGLGEDVWNDLLRILGKSLHTVSAFQSRPMTGLQFVSSVGEHCPLVERIRLPSLWGAGNPGDAVAGVGAIDEEELYDAISELMELEDSAPYCATAALRAWTDFSFCFVRRLVALAVCLLRV